MRKLKGYMTGFNMSLTNDRFFNVIKHTNFSVSDLMLSVLTDKSLTTNQKAILGVIFDDVFSASQLNDLGDGTPYLAHYMASDVLVESDNTLEVSERINTDYFNKELGITKRAIFNNLHDLVNKGIINFGRKKFSEHGRITLNLGYLVNNYYKGE